MNLILWILMVALYISSVTTMLFAKGEELLGIGLFAAAMFVGAMELSDRIDKRWGSK